MRMLSNMRMLSSAFAIIGLLVTGYWAYEHVHANLYQASESRRLSTRAGNRNERPMRRPYARAGSAIAVLSIPHLGLKTVVVEGVNEQELRVAAGHVPGTALPGESGNIAVAGHRDTFFRSLRHIRNSDEINLNTPDGQYRYRVISTKVTWPDDITVLRPTPRPSITLITCYPFTFVGAAPKRFIVRAELLDSTS